VLARLIRVFHNAFELDYLNFQMRCSS